jgi:hypothetical protein
VESVETPAAPTELESARDPSEPPRAADAPEPPRRPSDVNDPAMEALAAAWQQPMLPSGESPWSEVVVPRGTHRRDRSDFPGLAEEIPVPGLGAGPASSPVAAAAAVEDEPTPDVLPDADVRAEASELDPELVAAISGFDATKLVSGVLAALVIFGIFAFLARGQRREVVAEIAVAPPANDFLLESEPAGALVVAEADGRLLGRTPLRFLVPAGTDARVFLVSPEHEPLLLELPERGGIKAQLSRLQPGGCEIALRTADGVAIEAVGVTEPLSLGSAVKVPGALLVRPREGEGVVGARLVFCPSLGGAREQRLSFSPRGSPRALRVTEPADATAFLDGDPLGRVPASGRASSAFALVRVDSSSGMSEERWVPTSADLEVRMPTPKPRRLPQLVVPEGHRVSAAEGESVGLEPEPGLRAALLEGAGHGARSEQALALYREGWAQLEAGKVKEAREPLKECARLAPDLPECHRGLGALYKKMRNPTKAALHLRRYLELAPDAADAERVRRDLSP